MRGLHAAAAVASLMLATACAEGSIADTTTVLEDAYTGCTEPAEGDAAGDTQWRKYLKLGDDGHTLIVDTGPEDEGSDGLLAYLCVMIALDTSEAVTSSIETTTSMMGRQTRTDNHLTYEWSFHPDNGLYILITDE